MPSSLRRASRRSRAVSRWSIVLLVSLLACVRASEIRTIEITGSHSLRAKQRIGEAINTPERLTRLRGQVKQRFPALTEADLSLLFIGWDSGNASDPDSKRAVVVVVGMNYHPDLPRREIVSYARDLLEPEVAALAAGAPPVP